VQIQPSQADYSTYQPHDLWNNIWSSYFTCDFCNLLSFPVVKYEHPLFIVDAISRLYFPDTILQSLTTAAAETVVHAFVASRLDYCNALLYGVSDRLMRRLQSVQNTDVRLVTGVPRCNHITPILQQLHWLPVRQRILFKIAVLVFQCLVGQAPSYLSDDCQPVSSRLRRLTCGYIFFCKFCYTFDCWCHWIVLVWKKCQIFYIFYIALKCLVEDSTKGLDGILQFLCLLMTNCSSWK